ncbi:3-alpha-hydroxysteroid sulfotransferase-like isoform X4 [Asterias amurensis]|uniref:3-alpha-hydroxysteroid sulfotransferase-like isoform X4 n=1 Tax=Asterias amurensis TaxID=7602 RepID=UPI003AB6EC7E
MRSATTPHQRGTHWLWRIVEIILDHPALTPTVDMGIMEVALQNSAKPFIQELQQLRTDRSRIIATHLPLTLFPKSILETEGVKIIYCMRNFFDVVASSIKFAMKLFPVNLQDNSMRTNFLSDGKCMYGGWAEHIKLMWARREEKNTLVIKFEELKTDFEQTARVIGDFLGRPLSPDKLRQLGEGSSIDRMKTEQTDGVELVKHGKIVDKGEISSWRGLYSDEDFALLKKYVEESLTGTGIHFPTGDDIN